MKGIENKWIAWALHLFIIVSFIVPIASLSLYILPRLPAIIVEFSQGKFTYMQCYLFMLFIFVVYRGLLVLVKIYFKDVLGDS